MEYNITIGGAVSGILELDYQPCINYAMILNKEESFTRFTIFNRSEEDWRNLSLRISGEMFVDCQLTVPYIGRSSYVQIQDAHLLPDADKLMALTEAMQTQFGVEMRLDGKVIFFQLCPILVMCFDQWMGTELRPELTAAFVTPNHPSLTPIMHRAAELMKKATGDPSLNGYMSGDFERIRLQVKSVYEALREQHFIYTLAPCSFEKSGQRIRMANQVLATRMGTCIDLSLLLCSCLECLNLKTMVIMNAGHALMAVWIDWDVVPPSVGDDYNMLYNNVRQSILLPLEATCLCQENKDFEDAVREGMESLERMREDFEVFVDIFACRMMGIRPLPHSTHTPEGGWIVNDPTDYDQLMEEIIRNQSPDIRGVNSANHTGKIQLWERKLLDLSLRNNLINMKVGRNIVALNELPLKDVLSLLRQEKLDTLIGEKEHFATIKDLYRAARTSLEENGANTLFLSLGTLRWYEEESRVPHFAPIVLLPIEIVRHSAKRYIIRKRDDETIINVTLMECLRQLFELPVPDFSQLPMQENGEVDLDKIFALLGKAIEERTEWEVVEEAMLGIFSFTKFVMWHDLHTHSKELTENIVLRSFMEGRVLWKTDDSGTDARKVDYTESPASYALPIHADSSQLEAVIESGKGKSFILYGPPGTGKSQTITNMIANALYHGKRVLFVAEKKAALEVVQERLSKIGLEPFCLELHSNKVEKKHFLAQMEQVINIPHTCSVEAFRQCADDLLARRKQLNGYIEALHRTYENGLSLFDCINHYLDIEGDTIEIPYRVAKGIGVHELDDICQQFAQLDTVIGILKCHPSKHPLLKLLPRVNTIDNQRAIQQAIEQLPPIIGKAEKKAQGWINRYFLKRTPLEIVAKNVEWSKLQELAAIPKELLENLEGFKAELNQWQSYIGMIRPWYHYSLRALELQKCATREAMDYFLKGKGGKQTADAFRKGVFYQLAMHIIENDENLRSFNGMLFDQMIDNFCQLTAEFQELTKQELFYRLSARVPMEGADAQGDAELTLLKRRISNKGRGTSIRRIIDQIPHLLPKLTPCMLMSPLSVAQYLKMDGEKFDLVIFDEASQMPTSEAVGAIARGKAVVVVGDPKQMPPTNFFNTHTTTDDESDIDDLESILDDCISLSFTSRYLNWHYRSRHESLIAFSNAHFYDGKLITFPSIDDQTHRVSFHKVEGCYDFGKTRSNKAEAKAIVDEVMKRLEAQRAGECPSASIGIVAFSKVQSSLIEDMLSDRLAKNTELEQLAYHSTEPIFVKNLENVQGDERDIILFSVGYGPDVNGKVSMNFGPLNQSGGERRLNVAVTRARQEMKVFSTLEPEQIDLNRTSAKGVLSLKRFLEYARDGHFPIPQHQVAKEEVDVLTRKIAYRIQTLGYECHTNVGRSKFKVDIAVVNPYKTSEYLLGIQIDNTRYYHTATAQDREIIQPKVLEQLGWKVLKVWTIDWMCDEERIVQTLISAIKQEGSVMKIV